MYLMAKHDPRQNRTLRWQQCHALHRRPNSNDGAKEDDDNGPAGGVGCSDHFVGGVGVLMGSGANDDDNDKDR
jgi:hypothetical protein